jgi:pSer/pThr/pTyr-binding forkhead associated (FHA) protein
MVLLRKKRSCEAARIVQLTVIEGNNDTGDIPGKVFYLQCGNNFIGRDPLCEVVLNSRTISRKHANVHVSYDKKAFHVHDLGSANGVIILPGTVLKNDKRAVKSGDEFQVGEIRLKLLVIDPEESLKTMDVDVKSFIKAEKD